MKGILLAGGAGTRLHPATLAVSKQLLPVYDKPLVYYPLSTLMLSGIREVLLISTPQDTPRFEQLLGDGARWGLSIRYAVQPRPGGIAQALLIARDFLAGESCALVLGDNIFHGNDLTGTLAQAATREHGATVFAYPVHDPQRYGVVEFDASGRAVHLEEKPAHPRSRYAGTGLNFDDGRAAELAATLQPWLDTGTHDSLLEASQFIQTLEKRQGLKVACPEEIAWRQGWIDEAALTALADSLGRSGYGEYLRAILRERLV